MNNRGIIDDWFDFIFTLLAAFLLFILIYSMLISSIDNQNQEAIENAGRITTAYNLIIENKIDEEARKMIDIPELQQQLKEIQQIGYVSSPADFPDVGGY